MKRKASNNTFVRSKAWWYGIPHGVTVFQTVRMPLARFRGCMHECRNVFELLAFAREIVGGCGKLRMGLLV